MKSAMKHIFTVLLLLFCVSCISDRETRAVLDQVEALIDENPAEAYELVKGIDGAAISSSAVNARYALLYTKAEYKNYIDAPTDSLISIAADYYEKHGSDEEKFYAYLYQGCVNNEIKDIDHSTKAVNALLSASMYSEVIKNKTDVGLMYILLSALYGDQYSVDEEICARKALSLFQRESDSRHILNAMGYISISKLHKGEYDSCYIYADSMYNMAIENQISKYTADALFIKAQCAVEMDSLSFAFSIYSKLVEEYNYCLNSQDYSRLSIIKASEKDIFMAEEYLSFAKNEARTFNDSIFYYASASKVYRFFDNEALICSYQDSVLQLENKMLSEGLRNTVLASQKAHADYLLSIEKYQNKLRMYGLAFVILLIAIILIVVVEYAKKQKLLAQLQAEKIHNLQQELEKHKTENLDALEQLCQTDIVSYFQSSINDIHAIIREKDWNELYRAFDETLPSFERNLKRIHDMTEIEWRVCMLLKLGFSSSEIAKLTNKSATTIPSIRSRLYRKFFMTKGKASEWDVFIASI